jgi:hypothetical protein
VYRLLASLLFISAAWAADTPSALSRDARGWKDILPPPTFKNWVRVSIPPDKPLSEISQWKVDSARRVLICDGNGGHEFLRYTRVARNAIFHVEWKYTLVEGRKNYNSGIYIRNSADGRVWHQAQIGSSSGGYLFGNTLIRGIPMRINLMEQLTEQRVKPAGEWNVTELSADGSRISFWVNGAVTSLYNGCEVPSGFVGLEAEGYRIEFRNLKLKTLP